MGIGAKIEALLNVGSAEPVEPQAAPKQQYDAKTAEIVAAKYSLCATVDEKKALAQELGIDSLAKLYNLASRLKATGFPIGLPPVKGVTFTRQGLTGSQREKWMSADRRFIFSKHGRRWQLRAAPGGLEFDRELLKLNGLGVALFPTRRAAYEALQLTLASVEEELAVQQQAKEEAEQLLAEAGVPAVAA